jgi:mevalonate kinase
MAINMHAFVHAEKTRTRTLRVEADIPLSFLGSQTRNVLGPSAHMLLEPLRLAARESLDYVRKHSSGISLDVDCEIPVGAGLGSSAATTVAIIAATSRAMGVGLDKKEIFEIAFGPESYLHGSPSGVDQATTTYGDVLRFTKKDGVQPLRLKRIPQVLVCDSGIHRSTGKLVRSVVKRSMAKTRPFQEHVEEVSQISEAAIKALRSEDDQELGQLMNRNQELLEKIGVSHPKLEELVKAARAAGAWGAKLTGAGGGGCIIAVCKDEKSLPRVLRVMQRHGGTPYRVARDIEGVVSGTSRTALK